MIEARIRASIEAFVAAWNEHDPAKRAHLVEQACGDDFCMRTPGKRIAGRSELDGLIADFQKRRPGDRAALSSAIDVQGRLFRYTGWVRDASGAHGGDTLDSGECDDEGRIRLLLSFVGAAPPRGPSAT